MVHAGHGAVRGHVHAHVLHGQDGPLTQRRHGRAHPSAGRQGRPPQAGTVDRLRNDRVGAILGRVDDHVVGLGVADLELVHLDGPDVLAVGCDDRELQARNADVEDHLRRTVNKAQAHPLAGLEEPGPVVLGAVAVDEEGHHRAGDVRDVGRVHEHLGPFDPLGEGLVLARKQAGDRLALIVEDPALLLQPLENQVRVHLAMVG